MTVVQASAQPEKRLFISLLTRDISLVAAFLDLVDNSINSSISEFADQLRTAQDYLALTSEKRRPKVHISLKITNSRISITDNASGIDCHSARSSVFRFGRPDTPSDDTHDRLSVYGIGLKRAIFKMGDRIRITSDHEAGGFELDLDVPSWERTPQIEWEFPIETRNPAASSKCGTKIEITALKPEVEKRLSDPTFLDDLLDSLSKTYAYFIGRFVEISLNGKSVSATPLAFEENRSSETHPFGGATYSISAGIAQSPDGNYKADASGWFVFCNGRAVIYADKTPLTGWGVDGYLPQFQPKHRPFLGLVFFVSPNPENLPWTTTKASINQDSSVWQDAKRRMASVARPVITYLDRRYSDVGLQPSLAELAKNQGPSVSFLEAAASPAPRQFAAPERKPPNDISIQYRAKRTEIERIRNYIGDSSMSAREIGRYTFDYFLENEVGD